MHNSETYLPAAFDRKFRRHTDPGGSRFGYGYQVFQPSSFHRSFLNYSKQQIYAYCTGNPDLAVIYLSASKPQYSEDMIKKDDFTQIAYK